MSIVLTAGDIIVLMLIVFVLSFILMLSWSAHKQYMIGHNTWLFTHKTDIELRIQVAKIKAILDDAGGRYKSHDPTTWSEQAQMAADGKWDELKKWQDELDGGL